MLKLKSEIQNFKEYTENLSTKPINNNKKYWNKTGFVFCEKCNETVFTPEAIYKLTQSKIEQWKIEGFWNRNILHGVKFIAPCVVCGHHNLMSLVVVRYLNKKKLKRYKVMTIQHENLASMEEFWKKTSEFSKRVLS